MILHSVGKSAEIGKDRIDLEAAAIAASGGQSGEERSVQQPNCRKGKNNYKQIRSARSIMYIFMFRFASVRFRRHFTSVRLKSSELTKLLYLYKFV